MESKILEINLISAQGLKPPSSNLRQLQTYAVVWVNPSTKLRSRIDQVGGENPTWNDKFLFKVTPEFLSSETSGVFFEIYAVGCLRNPLIGTVRFLISTMPPASPTEEMRTPSFVALQIRRPSGRFQGILNVGAFINDTSDFATLHGVSAIGYRDLMGESIHRRRRHRHRHDLKKSISMEELGHGESSCGDSGDFSDGADSTTSSSSAASTTLKDWNGVRELAGTVDLKSSDGGRLFCGLLKQRRLSLCMSAQNLQIYGGSRKEN